MSEIAELAEKLKKEGEKFYTLFAGLTQEEGQREVYTEGAIWTVRSVLSHFVTSERGLIKLFEQIRQGGPGAADDFSIDRYNAAQQEKTKELALADLLDQYKMARSNAVDWTLSLSPADLEKQGRHPFLGMTTIREMIKMLYIHNQIHYRDMKKVLK